MLSNINTNERLGQPIKNEFDSKEIEKLFALCRKNDDKCFVNSLIDVPVSARNWAVELSSKIQNLLKKKQ